jgi:HK97 gp10 family phage protein
MPSELEGLNKLSKQLSELGSQVGGKALRSATMQASLPIAKKAKANAPIGLEPHKTYTSKKARKHPGRLVGAGFLSRNVARKSRLSKDRRTAYVFVGVKPEAFYGVQFLELGTSRIRKRPWLTKAMESSKSQVIERLKDRLKKNIVKAAR